MSLVLPFKVGIREREAFEVRTNIRERDSPEDRSHGGSNRGPEVGPVGGEHVLLTIERSYPTKECLRNVCLCNLNSAHAGQEGSQLP